MKPLRAIGSTMLFIIGILLIIHSLWNWGSGAQLRKTLRVQEKQGLPMGFKEITPPDVEPEANAAPLLDEAFTVINQTRPDAILQFDAEGGETGHSLDELDIAQRAQLTTFLDSPRLAPAFAALEKAATKSGCDFNLDYTRGPGLHIPYVSYQHKAVRMMGLRAWLRADKGDVKGALEDIRRAFQLSRHLQREPVILSQRVYMACVRTSLSHLNAVLRRSASKEWTEALLQAIESDLGAQLDPTASAAARAIDGERIVFGKWLFERAITRRLPIQEAKALDFMTAPRLQLGYVWRPWLKNDYRHYLKFMAGERERVQSPVYIAEAPASNQVPFYCPLTRALMPTLDHYSRRVAEHRAGLKLARLGVQACRQHLRTGRYPASLDGFGALPEETTDPFTGQPFHYRVTDRGFVIYSTGPDGRDDGGVPLNAEGTPADIVWEI